MYKRPLAYVCAPENKENDIQSIVTREYCKTLFKHGYTPIAPYLLFSQFIDPAIPEQRNDLSIMNKVLIRKSRIMFVCGDIITDDMKNEMLYARDIGLTVVTIDSIEKIEKYLKKASAEE